jgi:arylsulfatase A-like enzyme
MQSTESRKRKGSRSNTDLERRGGCLSVRNHSGVAKRLARWLAVGSVLAALPGCRGGSLPDVVLVTVDTLRADQLPFYGYSRPTMPNVARWLESAAVFDNCYSPLPLTDPSMASIMTGLYPMHHGIRHTGRKLPKGLTTLAEILQSQGYATAAFVSRAGLLDSGGLRRGFTTANFAGGRGVRGAAWDSREGAERWQRRAASVTDAALEWLDGASRRPYFLWLHYFDPHAYYDPAAPFRDRFEPAADQATPPDLRAWWGEVRDLGQTIADYDAEILTVDHHLDRVVEKLRERGRWDETLFILTSDHGESLGERGHMDHGEWLYQEQVRVPLVMRLPGRIAPGARIPELVRLIDLAPTVIDLLGVGVGVGVDSDPTPGPLAAMDGQSFASLLYDSDEVSPAEPWRRQVFLESENCPGEDPTVVAPGMLCSPPGVEGKLRGVFDGRFKLIITPRANGRRSELYDLQNDPGETTDRSAAEPERVAALQAELDRFWNVKPPSAEVDGQLIENLRALGYAP